MLTNHQQDILDKAIPLLLDTKRLLIRGKPGVGKTYLMQELLSRLIKKRGNLKIYCTAPVDNAKNVLRKKISIPGVYFMTTHKALKYKCKRNIKTGKLECNPSFPVKKPPLKGVDVLVIDEVSMEEEGLVENVEKFALLHGVMVVMLGDIRQLPPVGEKVSKVFEKYAHQTLFLTEVLRQKEGNNIHKLRDNPELLRTGKHQISKIDGKISGFAFEHDLSKIVSKLANSNYDDTIYLAFTNKEVDRVNKLVRKMKYGNTPNEYEIGEKLIFTNPYLEGLFRTNSEIIVKTIETQDIVFNKNIIIKCFVINKIITTPCFSEREKINNIAKKLFGERKYEFLDSFAHLKYTHALTIHRSQGKTYDTVFLNLKDTLSTSDEMLRKALIETARSRPRNLLVIYNW